jgi:hypothetical protein
VSIRILKSISGTTSARWAKKKGISKLQFVLAYGGLFGLFVTILSRSIVHVLDIYWFPEETADSGSARIIGSLFGLTLMGFWFAALAWEQAEDANVER